MPLRTVISSHGDGRRRPFAEAPVTRLLHARFRSEWRFRATANNPQQTKETR
ncbi:hypothetical protein ABZW10_05825 [Kitasatospora sp. NPDC004723]|uniref:hypothetical protein n=1 Tax=Kitasatospora sp. NPDC004723 TaxID=3154288 RepID=UPI00339FD7BF